MKPATFDFSSPATMPEILAALAQHGEDARLLAGGQSLVPMLNMRVVQPAVLVSINACRELDYIRDDGGRIAIGALTRQIAAEESPIVARRCPLLARVLPWLGGTANRNRGTVCGSLAHADPLAELPAAALALEAEFTLASVAGTRRVAARDFFTGPLATAIRAGEMLVEVAFPACKPGDRHGFAEVSNRRHGFAVAGVVARLSIDDKGRCSEARIAAIGGAATAIRLIEAERAVLGATIDPAAAAAAAACARREVDPVSDIHADAAYRREVVGALVARTLLHAA